MLVAGATSPFVRDEARSRLADAARLVVSYVALTEWEQTEGRFL
jgi:hypothetical protein